jgi:ABC-type glycerol-3-phosphate transport system permease component
MRIPFRCPEGDCDRRKIPGQTGRRGRPAVGSLTGRQTYGSVNYGLLLAGAVIAMIPCIVVYVALQRYYVGGLVSGALKG